MKTPKVDPAALRKAGGKPTNQKMPATGVITKGGVSKAPAIKLDRRWEIEDAARTILRAEELKSDAKLMAEVKRHTAEQAARVAKACK